jgi:hypothetical protein
MCRGTTGAPCVAWFSVPSAEFVWLLAWLQLADGLPQ